MEIRFNVKREREHKLVVDSYQNDKCILQFHSPIEIYMVDEGEMELRVNGKTRLLQAGQLSVALSYDTHSYKTPMRSKSSILQIPPHLCEEFMASVQGKRLQDPFITDRKVYDQIRFYHAALQEPGISRLRQLGYVHVVLGLVLENASFEAADKPLDMDLVTRILFYTNENFQNDITPGSVARHFGYNQSYISRYFKACCGIPLVQYLTAVRLENAVTLLRENKHDITECAMESGFSSLRTFYRAFHNAYGCSPSEYLRGQEDPRVRTQVRR